MKSPLIILRRVYLNITGNHCAAKLIEYFKHWRTWKVKNHRTDWIYLPLKKIYDDLMAEHSLHVIRAAIALLIEKGIIKRQNNPGNGQDKTYQYQLQVEKLEELLSSESRTVTEEIPESTTEFSENIVEQHTQIPSTDIQSLNIRSIPEVRKKEEVKEEIKEETSQAEEILDKYEEKLKYYGIYREIRVTSDAPLTPNPKLKPIQQSLNHLPKDRIERSLQAFLLWVRDAKNVEDKYKALNAALWKGWD